MLHDVGDPAARAGAAGLLDDERHADRLVVDEQTVLLFAVIAEAFAVIRQQDDRRAIVELLGFQMAESAGRRFSSA